MKNCLLLRWGNPASNAINQFLLVMRFTTILLLLGTLHLSGNTMSQTVTLNVQNVHLKRVFAEVERQTGYTVLYSDEVIDKTATVSVNVKEVQLEKFLTNVLSRVSLTYRIDGSSVFIKSLQQRESVKPRPPIVFAVQQQKTVSGLVTDLSTGETLIGATVRVKDEANTEVVVTDAAGKFTIGVPSMNSILSVSFLGYMTGEVSVDEKSIVDVKLSKQSSNLEEVVITGFGLTTKKATLSGAIATVGSDELSHSRAATATGALVGRVPGVNFRQSLGRPGSGPTLQIRNFGTPMIIIDGVTRDYDSFSQLDFNDIETISVLKDGSASIYGMQASNGAVVITTKSGRRNQKPTVGFQTYYGAQTPSGYNKPADAKTLIRAIVQDETYNNRTRTITREEYDKWMNESDEAHTGFDWYDYIWQTAPQYYNSLNFSGGSENSDYYVSVGNLKQQGLLRNFEGFSRTNFQSNINANVSKRIKVGVGITARLERTDQPGLPGDDYGFAEQTAFRNLPTLHPYANNNPAYPAISTVDPQFSYGWIANGSSGQYLVDKKTIQLNGNIEVDILSGLKARMLGSYGFGNIRSDLHEKSPILYSYDEATQKYNVAYAGSGRYVERNIENREDITANFQLNYTKSFGKHNAELVAGMEYRSGFYPRLYVIGSPEANGISFLQYRSLTSITDDVSYRQNRIGYLFKANYDYAGKFIAEFAGRYDGSYLYKSGSRFGFFPSGSVAYRVSEENFWKDNPVLGHVNDFKIRASYGITGKELGSALTYIPGYSLGEGSAILDGNEIVTTRVSGLPTDITWGRVKILDFGADIIMLDHRLTGGFDWFNRHETGELGARYDFLLPDLVGFTAPNMNLNGNHTRGIDFSVNWKDAVGKVNYFVGGNFTFSRWITGERYKQDERWTSEWNRYRNGLANDEGRYRDGTFQLVAIGQFKSWEEIANHPIDQDHAGNTTIRPGDFIYKDINNDGYINDLDMNVVTYRINSNTPPWINFAFNLGASYNGFDFRADFTGATGYTYEQQGYMRYFDATQNVSQYLADNSTWYNDIWDKNSGFKIGKYPLLTRGANNWMNTHWPNSYWQTNVTYVKLRNLEVGYSFSYNVLRNIGLSNLRIYASGQNILTISNMPAGLDPEITNNAGISYPNPNIYSVGVQVKF